MTLRLMGKKKGMTRFFDKDGNQVVCTVILVEPNVITQIRRKETEGYEAVQLSAFRIKASKLRNVSKPLQGHFAKAGVEPRVYIAETRTQGVDSYQVGQEVGIGSFSEVSHVDVAGMSKGKGYQGVIKRHHFAGGPASHGSGFHRHGGSCGMRSTPGRCLPGQKKAGRMGFDAVTTQNLKVVAIDEEKQVILVEGAVPGARGGLVYITESKKKSQKKK